MLVWRIFFAGGGQRPQKGMDTPPVRVAQARAQDVPYFLNGLGTVLASSDVLVKSRVDGQLMALHFVEGQHVRAGDLLAEIDPRPFAAALAEAEGRLAHDQAQLANARRDLKRYAALSKKDYIARQQYDAQAALVAQYEGSVAADKAGVETARLQLEYSRITAPAGGRTGLRAVDVGNQIKSSDANGIVRITTISPCEVLFTLPEAQVSLVAQALAEQRRNPEIPPLPVQAWDREQKKILARGTLLSLDNQIDADTGTIRLKARFDNTDFALYPNQFVNARLRVQVLANAVTIPASAVQLGVRGPYVYVVEKDGDSPDGARNMVKMRQITPGISTTALTVVNEGLTAGETVVVDGLDRLRDGIAAKIAARVESPVAEPLE